MRSSEYTRDLLGERLTPDLAGLLAGFGEEVAAEPESLEEALRRSSWRRGASSDSLSSSA